MEKLRDGSSIVYLSTGIDEHWTWGEVYGIMKSEGKSEFASEFIAWWTLFSAEERKILREDL